MNVIETAQENAARVLVPMVAQMGYKEENMHKPSNAHDDNRGYGDLVHGTNYVNIITYGAKGYEMLREPNKKVFGKDWLNLFTSFMCNPASVFEAMRGEGPYPVKAFFALGSNALMCYVNQRGAFKGLMNQELIVVQDHWLTPTAQLADYILPSDYYMERPALRNQDHSPAMNMQ